MPGEIRAGPGALLQRARSELGRSTEKDRRGTGAADRLGHAPVHRAGNEGWYLNGKQALREGEQPAGRRIRPNTTNELHHISRCEQPVRMGDEPAAAEEGLPLETCHANGRADNENEAEFEERLDTGGGPRVPCALA